MDNKTHKFPQDAPLFGKPNVIINPQSYNDRHYDNQALQSLTPDDIVELAEQYQPNMILQKDVYENIPKAVHRTKDQENKLIRIKEFGWKE